MADMEELLHNVWFLSAVILGIVVIAKILSEKSKTVDVLWLIVLGALFANIGILPTHNEVLEYIGEWGIVFVMFALGFDEDIEHFKIGLKRSFGIAVIGAIFPFLAGYISAKLFGYSESVSLLWGLTMTATAVSLTMVSLKEKNLHKSTAATGIMTAAVVDDILSLIGVAIIVPLALMATKSGNGHLDFDILSILWIMFKVVIFFSIILFFGLFIFPNKIPKELPANPTLLQKLDYILMCKLSFIRIHKFLTISEGKYTPLFMIFIAMASGALAERFGFHPAIGAYMAGLFLKKEYFLFEEHPKPEKAYNESKLVIDHIAFTIFGPIFFVNLGAKIIIDSSIFWSILPHVIILFILVLVFQVLSAAGAARYTGGYRWHESVMIGVGMLGRAELAFIVIDIAYTEHHIFNQAQFYTLIFATFLLNISVPLLIEWWRPYYNGDKKMEIFGILLSRPASK